MNKKLEKIICKLTLKKGSKNLRAPIVLLALATLMSGCSHLPNPSYADARYRCSNAQSYLNRVVGDGHCVSLIKRCSQAPNTSDWQAGKKVMDLAPGTIASGSIIATFKNGRYPNRNGYHAAIYISHDQNGIWVWDQWVGKPVHKRLIRKRYDKAQASNSAQAYRLVL